MTKILKGSFSLCLLGLAAALVLVRVLTLEVAPIIHVRWVADVSAEQRSQIEGRLSLLQAEHLEGLTWAYVLANTSTSNVRRLVQHPAVDDTHAVDRQSYEIAPDAPSSTITTWLIHRVPMGRNQTWLFWPLLPLSMAVVALAYPAAVVARRCGSWWQGAPPALANGLLLALSTLLCVGAGVGYLAYRVHAEPFERRSIRFEGDWPLQRDTEIGFVPTPNATTVRREGDLVTEVFTDARGARVGPSRANTPKHVDILTVGGSFSWGYGIRNEETFTEVAAARLNMTRANFAFGSYGSVQSLQLLRRNLDLEPRYVVYGFIRDHLNRNLSPCAPSLSPFCTPVSYVAFGPDGFPFIHAPRFDLFSPDEDRAFLEEVVMTERIGFADIWWRLRADLSRIRHSRVSAPARVERADSLSMDYLIAEMASVAASVDAVLVVIHIPYMKHASDVTGPPETLSRAVELAQQDHRVLLLDLSPRFMEHFAGSNPGSLVLPGDDHPNRAAHQVIGEELAALLATHE